MIQRLAADGSDLARAGETKRTQPSTQATYWYAVQWLWYAFWGPLPDRHRVWVLYNATCSTWILRHLTRILTIAVLPVAAVAIFLPAPMHIRLLTAFVAGAGAFLFTVVWVNEATEARLMRAGWRWGTGEQVRERRCRMKEWMGSVRKL